MSISCVSDSFPVGLTVLSRVSDGIQTELIARDGVEILFTLPSVELTDSGVYVCQASNKYGNHSDSVEITVNGKLLLFFELEGITFGQNQSIYPGYSINVF